MYSSECFGGPHAHHQEINNCSSSLWFYRWSVVVAVLLVVVGPVISGYIIHYHHISVMELDHLLTRSGLTYPEVSDREMDSVVKL